MKRLFVFLFVLILTLSVFTISVFADGEAVNAEGTEVLQNDEQTEDTITQEESLTKPEENENVFEMIYDKITLYSAEILSALTLLGSIVIAFTYKRGLLPTISGALSGIGGAVGELRQENEKWKSVNEKAIEETLSKLVCAEEMFKSLSQSLKKLEEGLCESREQALKTQDMRKVMIAQIDMLYDIFMSSGLPVYQKDEVSERVRKMKNALIDAEGENV